ncbi:MAG: LamG domain-containing protein [Verrucomicrobiae bacterium]|nr:LamG domain-containing protein [Verrucomicrobiae bacterium]
MRSVEWNPPHVRHVAALLLAAAATLSTVRAQTTLADFQFNEGTGTTTRSVVNDLVGTLGVSPNPENLPLVIAESPSGAPNDRAVQLLGSGFLVVNDADGPVLAVADEPLTVEAWVKWDGSDFDQYNGILGYGSSYKLGVDSTQIIWTLFGIVDVYSGLFLPQDDLWHHVAAVYEPGVGVEFHLDGATTYVEETRSMRAFANNLLSVGAEGLGNSIVAALDRVRVHKALLTAEELDSVAATPKPVLAATLVAYDFNETAPPFQSATSPSRPAITSEEYFASSTAPVFSPDSPTGSPGDFSMDFTSAGRRVVVPDPNMAISLDTGDFTVQAWVKFGPQTSRAVLFFSNGPGGALSFSILDRRVFVTTLGILDQPSTAVIPDDGGWHHIAVVHEAGTEFRFYVDGLLGQTVPYTGGVLIGVRTAEEFFIGSEPTGGLPYVGKLDRLRITNGQVAPEDLDFRVIPGVDPETPELTVRNVVEVAWPSLPAGYVLQSTTDISDPESWTTVPEAPLASEGQFRIYFPVTLERTFYRLVQP